MQAMIPDGRGSVTLGETADPVPSDDEVVIAVQAYSVNRGETFLLEAPVAGWRPGKDVAGTVIVTAADGIGPPVGQRVVAHPESGGWAECVPVSVDRLAALPDSIAATVAAALPLAGLTALRLVRAAGSLAGRRVLLTGASGGVGHFFIELAAAQGALITAVTRSHERGSRLMTLGADTVVTDVNQAHGRFDIVIESVGGDVLPAAWSRLTDRGMLIWLGQASRQAPVLDFFDWRGGASATLRKFSYVDSDVSDGDDLATLVQLVTDGHLHPEVDRVHTWQHTPAVLSALLARQVRGNAVLEIAA